MFGLERLLIPIFVVFFRSTDPIDGVPRLALDDRSRSDSQTQWFNRRFTETGSALIDMRLTDAEVGAIDQVIHSFGKAEPDHDGFEAMHRLVAAKHSSVQRSLEDQLGVQLEPSSSYKIPTIDLRMSNGQNLFQ